MALRRKAPGHVYLERIGYYCTDAQLVYLRRLLVEAEGHRYPTPGYDRHHLNPRWSKVAVSNQIVKLVAAKANGWKVNQ